MAPILEEMERRVKEEVGRVDVQFPSYVDDLHCGLYDRRVAGEEEAERERMQDLVARVQRVLTAGGRHVGAVGLDVSTAGYRESGP